MNYLFYKVDGEKEMLKEDELEEDIDCFQILSSLKHSKCNIFVVM